MKWFRILLLVVLSFIVTIVTTIIDAVMRNQLVAGLAGFPLRFSETSFFGGGETNYVFLGLDIIFWFVIILLIFKYLPRLFKK